MHPKGCHRDRPCNKMQICRAQLQATDSIRGYTLEARVSCEACASCLSCMHTAHKLLYFICKLYL